MAACSKPSMAVAMLFFVFAVLSQTGAQSIGVCYGRDGDNLPTPQQVVSLYQAQKIGRMRIYDPDQPTLEALRGSNIELLLGVPNPDLQGLSDAAAANSWVQKNVQNYFPAVKIKYIAVGNEVSPVKNSQYTSYLLPAMQNIYNAIVAAGLQDQIRVSTAIDTGVIDKSFPPSDGIFRGDVQSFIEPIIGFLVTNQAPLLVNVYPYFSFINTPNQKLSYALFTNTAPEFTDPGNNLPYQNLFDALLDSVYAALEKNGASGVEIVVSESGWPSAGGTDVTTTENARTYNQNLINHVSKGSPKKPDRAIETYVFAMFNENLKGPEEVEKHFGLFLPSQQPAYPINFA